MAPSIVTSVSEERFLETLCKFFLPVPLGQIVDKREPCVVGRFVPQARLTEHTHLIPGEHVAVKNIRTKDHITVCIPEIITELFSIILGNTLRKPCRNHIPRIWGRDDDVGISIENIRTPLRLVSEHLKIEGRERPPEFYCCLYLYDVRELVRDNISQPVVCSRKSKSILGA
jgi:hypothetical protein